MKFLIFLVIYSNCKHAIEFTTTYDVSRATLTVFGLDGNTGYALRVGGINYNGVPNYISLPSASIVTVWVVDWSPGAVWPINNLNTTPTLGTAVTGMMSPVVGMTTFGQPDPALIGMLQRPGGPDLPGLRAAARAANRASWNCRLKFYGSEGVIDAQVAEVRRRLSGLPGAQVADGDLFRFPLSDAQIAAIYDTTCIGVPSLNTFDLGPLRNGSEEAVGHVFFSPVIPRTGAALLRANRILGDACRDAGIPAPPVLLPGCMWERAFVIVIAFPVTLNPESNRRTRESFAKLVKVAAAEGWGEYRTAPGFYDEIMDTYSFNAHAHRRLCERIKDAVDPRGILAAGRYGIYPARFRR